MELHDLNPNFERDLECYTRMVNRIKEHGINFLGVGEDGHTVVFEKNGKIFGHNLMTWQAVPDPETPYFTEDLVVGWVIDSFKNMK
jgi:6-phosphogluconolactonase/glucosamine-6-phosphate isomerase/deaminase